MNSSIVSINDSTFLSTFNVSYEIVIFVLFSNSLVNEFKNNYVFCLFSNVDDVMYS